MKTEEKFLITGLLVTILGYVLYKVWAPEQKQMPLSGTFKFTVPKPKAEEPIQEAEIIIDDLTRIRESVTASMRN